MLRFIRQGQRWFVTGLVVLVGGVFVLFFGPWDFTQTAGSASVPIEVDGVQYTTEDLQRVRENLESRYRDALGDEFDAVAASLQLQDRAVRELVDRAILAAEARQLGLTASEDEVERVIRRAFSDFRDEEGRLDEEQARAYVVYEWGSVRRFKEAVRTDLALQKFGRLLLATAGASRAEARDSVAYREQEVRIAFVAVDPGGAPDAALVPGDVEEFQRREAARIEAYYQENLTRYQLPERLRLRHVLFHFGDDEDAARAAAEAAHHRAEAGEDLAALARELSEDVGSKDLGGDLGLLSLREVAAPLREAVRELELGDLAPVVRGEAGFHVVRLEERRPAETRPLEELAPGISEELYRQDLARAWATETVDALEKRIASGESLEQAARDLRLNIERTGFFRRRPDGFIGELGESSEAQTAAFALSLEQPTWPHPLAVGNRTVFIQLLERHEPDEAGLEARLDAELERLDQVAQQRAEQVWLGERRGQLQAAGRIFVDPSAMETP